MTRKQRKMLLRIVISAVLLITLQFVSPGGVWKLFAYLLPYLIVGHDILRKAARGIWNRQVFDENFLMAIATIGALVLGVTRTGDYAEAVAVMLFYQIGELFQSYAVGKSRKNISQLMDIRPDYANIEIDGVLQKVDPDEVAIGTVILVNPGEKIPIDGIVADGSSTLNTSALTGESLPRDVTCGDSILSGCINLTGVLKIRTTKPFGESTVSRILELVENATSRKSRSEQFISRFARYYTPIVCVCALALALIPPVIRVLFLGLGADWSQWIYRSLTFLVISCPCALVVSIPLSFFAGIGGAGKAGVLIKGSNYLEALSKAGVVILDKTGTLTTGDFRVSGIHHNTIPAEKLLEYAALAECASSHPISKSLISAYGAEPNRSRVTQIREHSGMGITAQVDGQHVAVGNGKLMDQLGIPPKSCHCIGTILHVAINRVYAGHIVVSDTVKASAKQAIQKLKKCGIRKTVMFTGDVQSAAEATAAALGIDAYYCQMLPADKVHQMELQMAHKQKKETIVFVGDGINDAPVLARSDIGIAMGAMGSDAAIEAADIVLMDDDPLKLPKAIGIAKKCMRIVYQNIFFAIGIKLLCLGLGALGIADLWLAIFADVGVMVLAVLNAIRALFTERL